MNLLGILVLSFIFHFIFSFIDENIYKGFTYGAV